MSLAFNAAPVNYDNNNINNINDNNDNRENNRRVLRSNKSKNTTYKNKNNNKINNEIISEILNDSEYDTENDNVTSNLGNFKVLHEPVQTKQQENFDNQPQQNESNKYSYNPTVENKSNIEDNPIQNQDNYAKLDSAYLNDYYNNYISKQENNQNYSTQFKTNNCNDELLKRLDNILHLLEEQQEEKTSYITEELILYVFLGIFVIYVLDSFVAVDYQNFLVVLFVQVRVVL